ncbi:MAG: GNAT family N-acetyltransferase [Planctomycetes bacterium]|nr:GNAT family N-acetyltransferase [Planctomycetota bacterium]
MQEKGQIRILNDGSEVEIRPLSMDDLDASIQFFKDLPEEDHLFLRVDVTDPETVKRRLACEENENVFRLAAFFKHRIVGDGVLQWPKSGWTSHVGEIRAITSSDFRRKGLATILFRELFLYGVREGLEKIEARMLNTQTSARACVEKLGFTEEGILPDFAMDLSGKVHDLVILSTQVGPF